MMLSWSFRTISTLGLRHGPDSHGGQQWGILDNGRKPDPAISRVNPEIYEGTPKAKAALWVPTDAGVRKHGENRIRYPGVAWLSSARVVRCLVKSYNERPRFCVAGTCGVAKEKVAWQRTSDRRIESRGKSGQ
ncbi:UNVERIFIED_CONTAM: hypothetical protein Scaly_3130600 [Sesamum calycinum]|uniref:Uncharacterized protein n=1 Tax=Sesamum calycinum TaxID=2727403 RepID=A0AAW2JHT5_9LAMI